MVEFFPHDNLSTRSTVKSSLLAPAVMILLAATSGMAQNANDPIREVSDRDKDGKPDFRVESFSRDGQRLMTVYSRLTPQGTWVVTSRAFHAGGAIIATETDKDQDGFFESLVVNNTGTDEMEGFTRQRDGSIKPMPQQALDASRKRKAAITDLVEKAIPAAPADQPGKAEGKTGDKP